MRLLGVILDDFRSIKDWQVVPLGGLTVLFGTNSAGKSNVLDALTRAVGGSDWSDADDPRDEPWHDRYLEAQVVVELDNRDVPGQTDQLLLHQLLLGEWGDGQWVRVLGDTDEFHGLISGATYPEVRNLMVDELVGGFDDDAGDRRLVAEHLLDDARVLRIEALDTWLECWRRHVPAAVLEAAERVATAAPDDDELGDACRSLLESGVARVECVAGGVFESRRTVTGPDGEESTEDWRVADVIALEYSADGLESAVTKALTEAWTTQRQFGSSGDLSLELELLELQNGQRRPGAPIGREWSLWIESRTIDGTQWARTHPIIPELARLLSERATDFLPGFVRDQGHVTITVRPLADWRKASPIDLALVEPDGTDRALERCGAGTRRWAAAAINLACLDLVQATWAGPALDAAAEGDAKRAYRQIYSAATSGALTDVVEPAYPERTTTVLLADEPEANLHPAAVESVVDWLVSVSQRTAGAVVATHHPAFLSVDDDDAHLVHVQRTEGRTVLSTVAGSDTESLDRLAVDAGLTRAELLQRIRMVLFVEGPHDRLVLDAYIGDQLHAARVLVLPMHGTRNALALVDSDLSSPRSSASRSAC